VGFINIDWGIDCVGAGHLVYVRLGLPDTLTDDLSRSNITFLVDLDIWRSWECYCELVSKGPTYHLVERSAVCNLVIEKVTAGFTQRTEWSSWAVEAERVI